jgi:hypothetical protein
MDLLAVVFPSRRGLWEPRSSTPLAQLKPTPICERFSLRHRVISIRPFSVSPLRTDCQVIRDMWTLRKPRVQ